MGAGFCMTSLPSVQPVRENLAIPLERTLLRLRNLRGDGNPVNRGVGTTGLSIHLGPSRSPNRRASQLEITMKALCWHGTNDIRCDSVPDPKIEDGRDVIIKVTSCAICGSDLHLMDGLMPTMKSGDILGHEFMGEVIETGLGSQQIQEGRPYRRSVQHQLRRVPSVQARQLFRLPTLEPQRGDGGCSSLATRRPACLVTPT